VTDETISKPLIIPILVEDLDEGMTMLLGPTAPATSNEIGVVASDEGPAAVHAMRARPQYLR